MKEWKIKVVNALNKKAESLTEINFREVANECGFKHIKTQEVKEIANAFLKQNPAYKAYRFVKSPEKSSSTESLFTTLVLSACEYETREEVLRELE